MKDIHATSARLAPQGALIWDCIEKEKGKYDWRASDEAVTAAYKKGIKIFVTVGVNNRLDDPSTGPGRPFRNPRDMDWI
ncbi:MAG: hypothetical protein PHX47_04445 [Candidatus ainarchaeum sp.]|nr:hypothetical protein [Candidatus ainarchaeum sp.]